MANLSNVALTVPRIVQRQSRRANVEHDTPEEYYGRSILIPFVDCLLQQLHDRFQGKTKDSIQGIFLIHSNLENFNAEVNKIKEAFSSDLPSPNKFDQEINLWKQFWSSKNSEVTTTISSTLYYIVERNIQ